MTEAITKNETLLYDRKRQYVLFRVYSVPRHTNIYSGSKNLPSRPRLMCLENADRAIINGPNQAIHGYRTRQKQFDVPCLVDKGAGLPEVAGSKINSCHEFGGS